MNEPSVARPGRSKDHSMLVTPPGATPSKHSTPAILPGVQVVVPKIGTIFGGQADAVVGAAHVKTGQVLRYALIVHVDCVDHWQKDPGGVGDRHG